MFDAIVFLDWFPKDVVLDLFHFQCRSSLFCGFTQVSATPDLTPSIHGEVLEITATAVDFFQNRPWEGSSSYFFCPHEPNICDFCGLNIYSNGWWFKAFPKISKHIIYIYSQLN